MHGQNYTALYTCIWDDLVDTISAYMHCSYMYMCIHLTDEGHCPLEDGGDALCDVCLHSSIYACGVNSLLEVRAACLYLAAYNKYTHVCKNFTIINYIYPRIALFTSIMALLSWHAAIECTWKVPYEDIMFTTLFGPL